MTAPVTLITGTRKGIGLHLARHFLEQGHQVVGCSRQAAELEHERYIHFGVDVTDEQRVVELFHEVRKRFGALDHLINNAGVAVMNHSLLMPLQAARQIMETNFLGTFLFCREAARLMQKKKHGRIVNLSTVAVPLELEGEAVYASSKAAVETLTRILAKEFAPLGITVNAVGPTPIDTDMIRNVPAEKLDALIDKQTIKRRGTFDDVCNVVDFFLSPHSGFVTGQILYLGGV